MHHKHPFIKFEGYAVNGKKEGKGVIHYLNGDKFIGKFVNDQIDGEGIYEYKDGSKIRGRW